MPVCNEDFYPLGSFRFHEGNGFQKRVENPVRGAYEKGY